MQGGPELLSWLDVVRPKLFTQIPSFVFPPGDSFLTPKETVNLIGGLTDQRDADTHRLSQLTAKFLREYFANMSMENRPLLYGQAQTDDQQLAFHKGLHDIFFSIQVHRRKQNKNIVGDPLKGPHPLVARAAKEKYIQGACFYIHPCVMKKVVQHVVEARRAFLLKKQGQGQCQAQPHVQPQTNRFGSIRMMKSCASLKANKMNNNNSSIRRMKSHASLKGTELTNMSSNNIIIPMVPIPTEDWGRRDPQAWLVGWDLEMESLAYMHRSSDFPRLGKMHERQLVYYQFARSVDEWMWRLEQAEKNVNYKQPEKNADCGQLKPKSPCEDTEELLIEL